jgi:hypothetical protein
MPIWDGSTQRGEVIDRLRVLTSEVRPRHLPFRNPEHQELFLSGLRMAAGEVP